VREPNVSDAAVCGPHFIEVHFAEADILGQFVMNLTGNRAAAATDTVFLSENETFLKFVAHFVLLCLAKVHSG
jgi:hypothetical protein